MIKGYQLNPYPIRIPEALREYLKEKAREEHRSLHAEIMHRLEQSRIKEEQLNAN